MYEDRCVMLSLRFPRKLWRIVNECRSGAIFWGETGATIRLNYKSFEAEFLLGEHSVFKTSSITSFIRQLNLYGFRKVTTLSRDRCQTDSTVHEFVHENFCAGRADLLDEVVRRTGSRNGDNNRVATNRSSTEIVKCLRQFDAFGTLEVVPMSRLQMCQLALKEALNQAVREYQMKKFGVASKELNAFDTQSEIYCETMNSLSSENFDPILFTTVGEEPKNVWYDEILYSLTTSNDSSTSQ